MEILGYQCEDKYKGTWKKLWKNPSVSDWKLRSLNTREAQWIENRWLIIDRMQLREK